MTDFTTGDMAGFASMAVIAYIEAAENIPAMLDTSQRIELGKTALQMYASFNPHCTMCPAELVLEDPIHGAELLQDFTTDMFHLVDGLTTTQHFTESAFREMFKEVHLTSLMVDASDSVGLAAATLGAVYAYASPLFDVDPLEFLTTGRLGFEHEAERERVKRIVSERRADLP